ncbi:MAG: glycosyltransferase [Acetobacter sp.]|nr:glycosyltransferase [Acetobacter sp.]
MSGIAGICVKHIFKEPLVTIVYAEDGFIKERAEKIAPELNNLLNKQAFSKKVDFYAANFFNPVVPKVRYRDHYNILWLGWQSHIDYEFLSDFDLILVSSMDLFTLLKNADYNVYFFPLVTAVDEVKKIPPCVQQFDKEKCYFVMIGDNSWLRNIFDQRKIHYKVYDKADYLTVQKIWAESDMVAGVVANDVSLHPLSQDFSPFFLDAIMRKVPVLTHFMALDVVPFSNHPLAYLLGDVLHYYVDKTDVEAFLDMTPEYRLEATQKAAYFVQYVLSFQSMAQRLSNILLTKQDIPSKISHSYSITSSTLPGIYNNGDYWIAKDLEDAFNAAGDFALVNFPMTILQDFSDVNIYIRGGIPLTKKNKKQDFISIFYILFPMMANEEAFVQNQNFDKNAYFDEIKKELSLVDVVVSASLSYVQFLQSKGVKALYVPQFTNTQKFYPDYTEELKTNVLFVGNKTFYRVTPQILLKHNIPVDIYGSKWGEAAIAPYIDNKILRKYYSSAKIVLNDTRPAMRKFGFISNRIFDATACGTLVISDYMPEIEEIYGDSVPMWKTEEELVALIEYYLSPDNEAERLAKAKRAQDITLKNFTAKQAAKRFEKIIQDVRKKRQI